MTILRTGVAGLVLLAALLAQAQSPAAQVSYGAITGRVICEDGPVPFATIAVSAAGGRGRGNGFRTVIADAEGNFKVDGLRAAALSISATAPGYVQESVSPAPAESETSAEPLPPMWYHIGESVAIRMVRGGVITGRVLSPTGEPVIGMRVIAQPAESSATAFPAGNAEAQTDDRGIYRIFGLAAGSYVVAAQAGAAGGFPGRPRDPLANSAPIYHPAGSRATAAEVAVSAGAETAGIDIQYRNLRGFSISGTVAGAASSDARGGQFTLVTLTHKASGQVVNTAFLSPRGGPLRRGTASGPDTFSILGVANGEYELTAQRNAGEDAAASAPLRVLINGADVSGLALTLKPLASLRARLQIEGNGTACPAPRPPAMEEQVFSLRMIADKSTAAPPQPLTGTPDRNGEVRFRALAAGRYHLDAQLLDERWFVRAVTAPAPAVGKAPAAKPLDLARTGLAIKSGEKAEGIVLTAAEGAASVEGKASKAGEWLIYLLPAERERTEEVLRYAVTRTNGSGAFRLHNLAPGRYWTLALPAADPPTLPLALDAAARLRLRRAAEIANQPVELQPCQRLTGLTPTPKP